MEYGYYRVETVRNDTEEAKGGYMCAINLVLSKLLEISPDHEDELVIAMDKSKDPRVTALKSIIYYLGDIPIPDIYAENKSSYVCLYRYEEFCEAVDYLSEVSDLLEETTQGKYSLYYKLFDDIGDEDIVYEDAYQIVITRERYENLVKCYPYNDLDCALFFSDEENEDFDEF